MLEKTDNAVHVHSNVLFLSLLGNAHKLNLSKYNREWSRIFSKGNLLIWKAFQTEQMVGTCEILGKCKKSKQDTNKICLSLLHNGVIWVLRTKMWYFHVRQ